jgi:hypothetical protein
MDRPTFVRLLRTPSSERFLLQLADRDAAVLDLHYLGDHTVQASLLVYDGAGLGESDVPALLERIDEILLPEVRLDDKTLTFTVAVGRVLGAYEAVRE